MESLLLALLLCLALDQGDRSQRLAAQGAVLPVSLIVAVGAVGATLFGLAIAPYLKGQAGLLFFSVSLMLGAAGLLMPAGGGGKKLPVARQGLRLYGPLLLHRLGDRSSFVLAAIAGMTGEGWTTAIGGTAGGLAALLPPIIAGPVFEQALPLRALSRVLGVLLLLAGLVCAVVALGLV